MKEFEARSSFLFDTVTIYLAFSEELLNLKDLGVLVTDDGFTLVDNKVRSIRCAIEWRNLSRFEDILVERLTSK
jgi:hypothetical protein